MKNRKALGIDTITAGLLKAGGDPMVEMLRIFNTVYDTEKTPKDWAQKMVTPIYKKVTSKRLQTIAQYQYSPSLAKVLVEYSSAESRGKTEEATGQSQFDFRRGRGTVDAIFIVRQIIGKATEYQLPLNRF